MKPYYRKSKKENKNYKDLYGKVFKNNDFDKKKK